MSAGREAHAQRHRRGHCVRGEPHRESPLPMCGKAEDAASEARTCATWLLRARSPRKAHSSEGVASRSSSAFIAPIGRPLRRRCRTLSGGPRCSRGRRGRPSFRPGCTSTVDCTCAFGLGHLCGVEGETTPRAKLRASWARQTQRTRTSRATSTAHVRLGLLDEDARIHVINSSWTTTPGHSASLHGDRAPVRAYGTKRFRRKHCPLLAGPNRLGRSIPRAGAISGWNRLRRTDPCRSG